MFPSVILSTVLTFMLYHAKLTLARDRLAEDIVRPQSNTRNMVLSKERSWPFGKMPYVINETFGESMRTAISDGIRELMDRTDIELIPRTTEKDYVFFTDGGGCSSAVGRIGGRQFIHLNETDCADRDIAMHELLHAYGMSHEQDRPDRDQYVEVNFDAIQPGLRWMYMALDNKSYTTLGVPYDFYSIMHYQGGKTFDATDWTIRARPEYIAEVGDVGQRAPGLTALDVQRVNTLHAEYVRRSTPPIPRITVQISLVSYYFDGRTAKGKKACATLTRTSPTQKCRIFFQETRGIYGDIMGNSQPKTYGPFADWGTMVRYFGKGQQHNITTTPNRMIEVIVWAYYAYYEAESVTIGKYEYVPLEEDERIGTFWFTHYVTKKQDQPAVSTRKIRPLTALTASFKQF